MISLQQVTKTFHKGKANEVTAVSNLSLEIQQGEFVMVVGVNGSGKSTLLHLIEGAFLPTSGTIIINGQDVSRYPEYIRSKWVARVFQNPGNGTAPDLSILENFRLAALRTQKKRINLGLNPAFKQEVRDKIATLGMGLENDIHRPMGSLSGGQRQALTLVMSVMDHSEILLLDEPTAALDPKSAQVVLNLAAQLIKEYGLTALFITHNLRDAHQCGSRLIQMQEGKVLRDLGSAEKSLLNLQTLFEWFA